jgi:hypothetical protein
MPRRNEKRDLGDMEKCVGVVRELKYSMAKHRCFVLRSGVTASMFARVWKVAFAAAYSDLLP